MSKPNVPNLSDLSPSEQMLKISEEIEKWKHVDPDYTELLYSWLSDAHEQQEAEFELECEHLIPGVDYDDGEQGYDVDDYIQSEIIDYDKQLEAEKQQEAEKDEVINEPELNNSQDLKLPTHTTRQIDELHKAFLGSVKPKEQSKEEIVDQMIARKLAKGALKLRKGK